MLIISKLLILAIGGAIGHLLEAPSSATPSQDPSDEDSAGAPDEDEAEAEAEAEPPASNEAQEGWLDQLSGLDRENAEGRLVNASVALGLSTVGALALPFAPAALPFLGAAMVPMARDAIERLQRRDRVATSTIDLASTAVVFATPHYLAISVALLTYHLSRRLLIETEDRSVSHLKGAFAKPPQQVQILVEGETRSVDFEALEPGHIIVVFAGQIMPADGVVRAGQAQVDQAALTGEAQPVFKAAGSEVLAATLVVEGRVEVEVTRSGSDALAMQVEQLLRTTADYKSTVLARGERVIEAGAWPTVGIGLLAWPLVGAESALAMSFAGFGFPMRIGAPLGILGYLDAASESGVLVKDGRSLELLAGVDTVVFDKTGTLTHATPRVAQLHLEDGVTASELLAAAGSAELGQSHPIAEAIINEARAQGVTLHAPQRGSVQLGLGLEVEVDGAQIVIGSARRMELAALTIPPALVTDASEFATLVYVARDGVVLGALELRSELREDARAVVRDLRDRGITLCIASGDRAAACEHVAAQLGIDEVYAEVNPKQKAELVTTLVQQGRQVCFIGDGINDALALKRAQVSISMAGSAAVALDAASVVLLESRLAPISRLFTLSQDMQRNLRTGTALSMVPGVIITGGVLCFHVTVSAAVGIYAVGMVACLANGLEPHVRAALAAADRDDGERRGLARPRLYPRIAPQP